MKIKMRDDDPAEAITGLPFPKEPTTLNAQVVDVNLQPQADRTAEIVDIMQQQTAKLVAMKALIDTVREAVDHMEKLSVHLDLTCSQDDEMQDKIEELKGLVSEQAIEQITNPQITEAKPLADAIQEAIKTGKLETSTQAKNMDDPANWSEASQKLWLDSMLMNIGVVLHKLGKEKIKFSMTDIQKFVKLYQVKRQDLGKGLFSYTLQRHKT
jgi:hypothetical protein